MFFFLRFVTFWKRRGINVIYYYYYYYYYSIVLVARLGIAGEVSVTLVTTSIQLSHCQVNQPFSFSDEANW